MGRVGRRGQAETKEVVGDDTPALQSVLEADIVRESLLKEEKELTSRVESGAASPEESSRLTEVFQSLEAIDSAKAPARAAVILSGLNFYVPSHFSFIR